MSVQSFDALCDSRTHTLVLGTMPGVASINAVEYYAHKRNAFWPIMLGILNKKPASYEFAQQIDYPERVTQLLSGGIGLWDVLAECERHGSLDSAIKPDSVKINDFVALFKQLPKIKTVAFNGKAAHKLFDRHALPMLLDGSTNDSTNGSIHASINVQSIQWVSLPSTSPAMASLSLQQKHDIWRNSLKF